MGIRYRTLVPFRVAPQDTLVMLPVVTASAGPPLAGAGRQEYAADDGCGQDVCPHPCGLVGCHAWCDWVASVMIAVTMVVSVLRSHHSALVWRAAAAMIASIWARGAWQMIRLMTR